MGTCRSTDSTRLVIVYIVNVSRKRRATSCPARGGSAHGTRVPAPLIQARPGRGAPGCRCVRNETHVDEKRGMMLYDEPNVMMNRTANKRRTIITARQHDPTAAIRETPGAGRRDGERLLRHLFKREKTLHARRPGPHVPVGTVPPTPARECETATVQARQARKKRRPRCKVCRAVDGTR